jgi:hypothetical protein
MEWVTEVWYTLPFEKNQLALKELFKTIEVWIQLQKQV